MRSCNAASMPRVRARQPKAKHSAYCVHRPYCSTPTSIDATQPFCKALWRNLSRRGTPFDSASYPRKSCRIVPHYSVTSIPGSAGRTPPALSLQGGWSLSHCGFDATILTQCVQLWDHSWCTCERFTHCDFYARLFHTPGHKRASTQRSLSAEPCGAPRDTFLKHWRQSLTRKGPDSYSIRLYLSCSLLKFVVSAWPVTLLQAAQDDLCILCTHGVSTRAKKEKCILRLHCSKWFFVESMHSPDSTGWEGLSTGSGETSETSQNCTEKNCPLCIHPGQALRYRLETG